MITPRFFHRLAAISAVGFLISFLLWPALWAPQRLTLLLHGLFSIPVLIALPGIIRGKLYTHAWSTLLTAVYVAWCAMEAYINVAARAPAATTAVLGALWFVSSNLFVRGQRVQNLSQ